MNQATGIRGVLAPVVTPFDSSFAPDAERLVDHCRWLLDNHVGLAVFGTNSEANSLSLSERRKLLDHLVAAGIPAHKLMPGTGACALSDAIELSDAAVKQGCAGVLMLPPFYYKGVGDEGLYSFYSEVIQAIGDNNLRIYLYHIPQVSQVPISYPLIERLLKEYPGTIAGIKDSSGKWDNTLGMLQNYQPDGFDVFSGSETFLLETLKAGGAGCISATANVNPAAIARLFEHYQDSDASERQSQLDAVRSQFDGYVMIAAMKAVIAHHKSDPAWSRVRPPLTDVSAEQQTELVSALSEVDFSMPGLSATG